MAMMREQMREQCDWNRLESTGIDEPCSAERLWQELRKAQPQVEVVEESCRAPSEAVRCSQPSDGSLALHIACSNVCAFSNLALLRLLVAAYPESVRQANRHGLLPIHKALSIATDHTMEAVHYLVDLDPSTLLTTTRDGMTPLHIAVSVPRCPAIAVVAAILHAAPTAARTADKYGQFPVHKAVAHCRMDVAIVELLTNSQPKVIQLKDGKGFTPLHVALSKPQPNVDIIFYLAEQHPRALLEVDYSGNTPLMR
jgi:ankyrin repeat protein